ncbi:hypothetical protein C8J56DRAFT_1028346 [Mycena floridula]|nr:hypothetical protein C8J56DRAFT_1028346 [Mycena floridula]
MFVAIEGDAQFLDDGRSKSVFSSHHSCAKYFGEYMFTTLGTIPAELAMKAYKCEMGNWYTQIRKLSSTNVSFLALRARISLRNQNLPITEEALEAEGQKLRHWKRKALAQDAAMRTAFESGDEKLHILSMTCVAYDHTFGNQIFVQCGINRRISDRKKFKPQCAETSQIPNKRPSSPSHDLDIRVSKRLRESRQASSETPTHIVSSHSAPTITPPATSTQTSFSLRNFYPRPGPHPLTINHTASRQLARCNVALASLVKIYCHSSFPQVIQSSDDVLSQRCFVCVATNTQPDPPKVPGESGLFIAVESDALFLHQNLVTKTVFSASSLAGSSTGTYFGEYNFTPIGLVKPQIEIEYPQILGEWYAQICAWPTSGSAIAVRARISLRNQKIEITEMTLAKEIRSIYSRDGSLLSHESAEAVRKAFTTGQETAHVLSMQCVSYDINFVREVMSKSQVSDTQRQRRKNRKQRLEARPCGA